MKDLFRLPILLVIILLAAHPLRAEVVAEERTMDAQIILKKEGLYYSEIDGIMGEETAAAISRYQIRYGLTVSGELDAETSQQLGLEKGSRPPVVSPLPDALKPDLGPTSTPGRATAGNTDAYQKPEPTSSHGVPDDHEFLREEEARDNLREQTKRQNAAANQPRTQSVAAPPAVTITQLFANSPFERASSSAQRDMLVRSQIALARAGYYRMPVDGLAGPATQQAIYHFQRDHRLRMTGSLDATTLHSLGVLRPHPVPRQKVYRGIWVR